ncbi:MAG: alpha-beta hydrolase superfamily lysophospholipase [Verrucomicrobiales bacterium]|jgi:alpha-beta hydrolase superfamily lysophospholipase
MIKWIKRLPGYSRTALKRILKLVAMVLFGGLTTGITLLVVTLNGRPDLDIWHEADLDEEFTRSSEVESFDDYVAMEERLFAQLKQEVYDKIEEKDKRLLNRFNAGSMSDASGWPQNWNRTWRVEPENPTAGVLLLHGMSDSPYSMRSLGQQMDDGKTAIIALRIPGHGTAPCGLLDVRWEDMAAAVKLAMQHLKEKVGEGPISMIGYSNGGALAVEYSLSAIEDSSMPRAHKLVLLSPSIGVSKMAAFAIWQSRLGRVLGLKKLAWNAILPEYEAYKYGSFSLNAARQAYRLTKSIKKRLRRAKSSESLAAFPPVLAFQSVVDATVTAPALVEVLFDSLPENGHELVLYDVNRLTGLEPIFQPNPTPGLDEIEAHLGHSFRVTILANKDGQSREIVARTRAPGSETLEELTTDLAWPRGIYSLSHVALPFAETDAIYGGETAEKSPGLQIGNTIIRGERGVLQIPAATMLRLRWNPFYNFQAERILAFLGDGS